MGEFEIGAKPATQMPSIVILSGPLSQSGKEAQLTLMPLDKQTDAQAALGVAQC